METLTITEGLLRLLLALVVGLTIGLEREWREKAAGLRTIGLVSAGSAAFMLAAGHAAPSEAARMAAGVSTGIGFLGAGTILRDRGEVLGLTTAASVWMAAALGIGAAVGAYALTIGGAVLSLFVLLVLPLIELDAVRSDYRTYEVRYRPGHWDEARSSVQLRAVGLRVMSSTLESTPDGITAIWRARGRAALHERAIGQLIDDPAVTAFKVT